MEVYLDNAATTKPNSEVVESMMTALTEYYGNPSSLHKKGVQVEKEIKRIRKSIGKAMKCSDQEVYFTASGTEANNLAIRGLVKANRRRGNHLITTTIEHKSVLNTFKDLAKDGYVVTYLNVDKQGFISLDELEKALTPDTILVSLIHINNEVGSMHPVKEIGKLIKAKNKNTLFHIDAVQSFGKEKINLNVDLIDSLSMSGHKIHGPKGIGALYVRKGVKIAPLFTGGSQEMGLRSGTENVPGIFGLGKAIELILDNQEDKIKRLIELKNYFIHSLSQQIDDVYITSKNGDDFAPHIINVSFKGIRSEIMLHSLEQDGIYVSSGSACSSKKRGASHVLVAMGMKEALIDSAIRISLSHINTIEEIDYAILHMAKHTKDLRKIIKR
ncbi:aminotransferase, class V [Alkaliphilus metalliredigens QYMF]|uniref:Aminotransferase, class V n=1 Tax=Alkaliphilus metalliredigens (strain QYMF) TaxID=293826 RepID=A6TQ95_ALKMQ|nr:cysteine desulfurase family protein [Alkaliphilus metalliredigens]ABR48363.1 aminotransferase, class V [Alkaliphilus metalliredigens QYMF]